jgi:hypothetical protein
LAYTSQNYPIDTAQLSFKNMQAAYNKQTIDIFENRGRSVPFFLARGTSSINLKSLKTFLRGIYPYTFGIEGALTRRAPSEGYRFLARPTTDPQINRRKKKSANDWGSVEASRPYPPNQPRERTMAMTEVAAGPACG